MTRVVAALAAVTFLALGGASAPPAAACSQVPATFTIRGEALFKEHDSVVFRIDEVRDAGQASPPVGSQVTVEYEKGDASYLDVGQSYLVSVFADPTTGVLQSGVHTADESCGGGGTVRADGREIDTAVRVFGVRAWIAVPLIIVLVLLGATASVFGVLRLMRHQTSPPR